MRGVHSPVLEIFANDVSVKGLYTCEGRNRFGVEHVTFNVSIFGKYRSQLNCVEFSSSTTRKYLYLNTVCTCV